MTAYVLVIVLAAGGHHQPIAVGYPDQGSCLVAAERVRRNKKAHAGVPEVRSGQVNRRERADVDFGSPARPHGIGAKKGPSREAGAGVV